MTASSDLWRLFFMILLVICFMKSYSFPNNNISMTFRLTHRSSPESPFYNSNLTKEEWVALHHRLMDIRLYAMNNTPNAVSLSSNLDFTLALDIGVKPFAVIGVPDTGSSLIWTQCGTCEECYEQDFPLFDPRNSSTYRVLDCSDYRCDPPNNPYFSCGLKSACYYSASYVQGTTSYGILATDMFGIYGDIFAATYTDILFGCGIINKDPSNYRIPSVFGLGNRSTSLVNQLKVNKFSFCQSQNPKKGSFVKFGLNAELLGRSTLLRTNPSGRYHLTLQAISVMNKFVNISSSYFYMPPEGSDTRGFYLDTGAKYTYLNGPAFDALLRTLVAVIPSEHFPSRYWDLCYLKNEQRYNDLPPLVFHFINFSFKVPRANVWFDDDFGRYCLVIKKSEYSFSVLGMRQMRGYNMAFDLDNHQLWIDIQDPCRELGH